MLKTNKPGSLFRVKWIEDTDDIFGSEWGFNMLHLEPDNNIVMLVKWRPEIVEVKDIINFDCLWEDKIYSCCTHAIIEIIKT